MTEHEDSFKSQRRAELRALLTDNDNGDDRLYGDVICANNTLQYYWSHIPWNDPRKAFIEQPQEWIALGTDGWWADQEQKKLFLRLKDAAGDLWPTYPGEWCRLDEIKTTRSYWIRRARRAEKARDEALKEIERLRPKWPGIPE